MRKRNKILFDEKTYQDKSWNTSLQKIELTITWQFNPIRRQIRTASFGTIETEQQVLKNYKNNQESKTLKQQGKNRATNYFPLFLISNMSIKPVTNDIQWSQNKKKQIFANKLGKTFWRQIV